MRKILMLLGGMLLLYGPLPAQSKTITGKVTDERGNPVPNASVVVRGTSLGTTSKDDGTFSLTAGAGIGAGVTWVYTVNFT
jgi:hypothetical protein